MRNNKAKMWFMAGTMVGAMGLGLGVGMKGHQVNRKLKRVKRNAANMAVRVSRDAGQVIGQMGDSIASKLR